MTQLVRPGYLLEGGRRDPYGDSTFVNWSLIMDFAGVRTGGTPYYRYNGTRYGSLLSVPGAVYTRSGVAYQQNASGTWVPFDENVPPISAGVGLGVWEARTNLYPRSSPNVAQLTIAIGTSDIAEPSPTPLAGLNWLALNNASAVAAAYQSFTTVPDATVVTWSCMVETPDGSQPVVANAVGATTGDFVPIVKGDVLSSVTTTYTRLAGNVWRVAVTGTTATSALGGNGVARYTGQNTRSLKFSGFQIEVGAAASPLILTTGTAATRGPPSAYLNAPGLIVPALGVTVVVGVTWPETLATTGVFLEPYNSTGAAATGFTFQTGATNRPRLIIRQGSGRADTAATAPVVAPGSRVKMAVSFDGTTGLMSQGGATLTSGATPAQGDYAGEPIYVGSRSGSQFFANGAINSVSFLRGLRTQAELNALTA